MKKTFADKMFTKKRSRAKCLHKKLHIERRSHLKRVHVMTCMDKTFIRKNVYIFTRRNVYGHNIDIKNAHM